ncbi:hypothetical protein BGY98DRAFT_931909 [Russula aff. rugulosa BPL654]|nr:hypothetical protein BGY98DRAFT_931909 [Russula aff. rugulosa BPL654]
MFHIKQEQSDHLEQSSLRPSISRLQEQYSEILPTASSSQSDGGQDVCIVIGEGAAQDSRQDLHTTDMARYGMAEYPSPPSYATGPHTYRRADLKFVQGIPEERQLIFPVNQGYDQPGHALQREIAGRTQPAVSYPPAQGHIPLGAGDLRELANHYINHSGSQVNAVCTERIAPGRYKVTIALDVSNLL